MRRYLIAVAAAGCLTGMPLSNVFAQHGGGHHHHHHHHGGNRGYGGWTGTGGWGGFGGYQNLFPSFGFSVYRGYGFGTPFGGYTSFGYPNYGPYYSYIPMAPTVIQAHPFWLGPNPMDNSVLRGDDPLVQQADNPPQEPAPIVRMSNPEARRRSRTLQAQGDEWFLKQNYPQAVARYKQAAAAAMDLAAPRIRLGVALAAAGYFDQAATEFKRALQIDPDWPAHAEQLDDLFRDNPIAKNSLLHRAAQWVREDIRDPDRLFTVGVLLYMDNDVERAQPFLQAADQLAGSPSYTQPFLRTVAAAPQGPPQTVAPRGAAPQSQKNQSPKNDDIPAPVPEDVERQRKTRGQAVEPPATTPALQPPVTIQPRKQAPFRGQPPVEKGAPTLPRSPVASDQEGPLLLQPHAPLPQLSKGTQPAPKTNSARPVVSRRLGPIYPGIDDTLYSVPRAEHE